MKRKVIYHALLFTASLCCKISSGQQLTILHTNDMHSKLAGYGPESEYSPLVTGNDNTTGGFARLSVILKEAKEKSPEGTLILDAGDFLMGSLFHVPEEETGFQLNLMKRIGYDFITFGNHEFDFGPGSLSNTLKAAESRGGYPQIVASNMVFSKESAEDDALEMIMSQGYIRPYVITEKNGLRIGILGLVGIDAANVAPASKPVVFSDQVKAAAKLAAYLKTEQKADLVILLSHCGINSDPDEGYTGEDIELAKKVPQVDIIISGHTHVKTPEYVKAGNAYIVQTGSYASDVGEISLNCVNGKIDDFKFRLIALDDNIPGDSAVFSEIEAYQDIIDRDYLKSTGLTCRQIVVQTNFDLVCDFTSLKSSNLGPFLADATMYYLESTGNSANLSLIAAGNIREDILKGKYGMINTSDIFRVLSLGKGYDDVPGYPLAKIFLTGNEIRKLMEVLIMAREKGGDAFMYFSGIKIYIDPGKGLLKKVQKLEIGGTEIDCSKKNTTLYSLTANNYLLSFIGEIKKMSHGLVRLVPKDASGNPVTDMKNQLVDIDPDKAGVQEAKEWIAVIEFMKSFDRNSGGIPVFPEQYRMSDQTVVDLTRP